MVGNESSPDSHSKEDICGWDELCTQINKDLKKKHTTLSLTQTNQLLLICNFATLHLIGLQSIPASLEIAHKWHEKDGTYFACRIRALALHYQLFEQLSLENQGGQKNAKSLL